MASSTVKIDHGGGTSVVMLSGWRFVLGCAFVAAVLLVAGRMIALPLALLAAEVFVTIVGLFIFGSFQYQIHKNALTFGMSLVIVATFCGLTTTPWHVQIAELGWWKWAQEHLLSFRGLDDLVHADTMLFILGLTFFVSVIAQTRILEGLTFFLLGKFKGAVLPTVVSVTALVAFASGILDGVSMIGLTIRTLVIIMLLAAAPIETIRYAVMVCTAVTTVCGIWLAYGEPPNLIMKANLYPEINDAFFLRYCAPIAIACYLVIAWQLRKRFRAKRIQLERMDVVDANAEDVRFLQAARHGEVLNSFELVEEHEAQLADKAEAVRLALRDGAALGIALVRAGVPEPLRKKLLGDLVSEDLADALDRHYVLDAAGDRKGAVEAEKAVDEAIAASARRRKRAQAFGAAALVPFIGMLVWHGRDHNVPLFLASFAGFIVALLGIINVAKMRGLALREARHEFAEYFFLLPLFLSISLLSQAGFFDHVQGLIRSGTEIVGPGHMAFAQFLGSTLLSAILDNNVVADFASQGLRGLDVTLLYLFAMAQISGYALGGCWTHIGSAQSVVAYAFIRRGIDERYTPIQWIKDMTPVIVVMFMVITIFVYIEAALLQWLG
jgi:hypothetical protein